MSSLLPRMIERWFYRQNLPSWPRREGALMLQISLRPWDLEARQEWMKKTPNQNWMRPLLLEPFVAVPPIRAVTPVFASRMCSVSTTIRYYASTLIVCPTTMNLLCSACMQTPPLGSAPERLHICATPRLPWVS